MIFFHYYIFQILILNIFIMKENNNEKENVDKKNKNLEDKKNNNSNLNGTKVSNGSGDFRELNKEIFQIIQQGGNISGLSITNLSNSSMTNNSIYFLS